MHLESEVNFFPNFCFIKYTYNVDSKFCTKFTSNFPPSRIYFFFQSQYIIKSLITLQVNLQTWVVLLDFFGIGTSPKKTYHLDRETEETFSWDKRLDIRYLTIYIFNPLLAVICLLSDKNFIVLYGSLTAKRLLSHRVSVDQE